jgi:hypothetical protein
MTLTKVAYFKNSLCTYSFRHIRNGSIVAPTEVRRTAVMLITLMVDTYKLRGLLMWHDADAKFHKKSSCSE